MLKDGRNRSSRSKASLGKGQEEGLRTGESVLSSNLNGQNPRDMLFGQSVCPILNPTTRLMNS